MDGDDWIPESERLQIAQILELDEEELQVEEVEDEESSDDESRRGSSPGEHPYDTSVVVLHSYLGDVEDTHSKLTFLDGGSLVTLTLFYMEGVVLFPDATLPLRVVSPSFVAGIDRAMRQDSESIIGVIRIYRDSRSTSVRFSKTGTTAEIRQLRRLEDGSINIVARGRQRFRVKRHWIDSEGLVCAEVLIVQEDVPLRSPREAVSNLTRYRNSKACYSTHVTSLKGSWNSFRGCEREYEDAISEGSFQTELSPAERSLHKSALISYQSSDAYSESVSSDDEKHFGSQHGRSSFNSPMSDRQQIFEDAYKTGRRKISIVHDVSTAYWPRWVYCMYDSFYLARKVADKWKQIVKVPNVDSLSMQPELLSFLVGSKIPTSESTRQELLDIDGTTYRLRREIELLESFDKLRCKTCKTIIAKRSNMSVMSSDGPLGAYANPHGYVHEVMTLERTNGVAVTSHPSKEYSWFPGYAWSIAECMACGKQLGWYFSATKKKMQPKAFWGLRSSQVEDITQ